MDKQVTVRCVCGCGILVAEQFDDGDGDTDINLSYYEYAFSAYQHGRLWAYLRRLWAAICGKRYRLYDVIVTQEEYKKLARLLDV
jgi:hypothetical protein